MEGSAVRKECLQSDLDELSEALTVLEGTVKTFARPETGKDAAPCTDVSAEPLANILRRRVQTSIQRIREVNSILMKEFAKLS